MLQGMHFLKIKKNIVCSCCICVCTFVSVHVYGGQGSAMGVFLFLSPHYFLRHNLSLNVELSD